MNLEKILEKHEMWLKGKKGGECANLSCADLRYDDLVFKIVYIISLSFLVYITYCYWIHIGYYDQQWHVRWFY